MSKITVIVPVYRVEPYLKRCVDSILGQTEQDIQILLVDDGSPDNCGKICDEYAAQDSRIHVIHQENAGLSAARNTGIQWMLAHSHSQWLTFVDSDDWLEKDCLKELYQAAERLECLLSACGLYRTRGESLKEQAEPAVLCQSADEYYCRNDFEGASSSVACGKLYHRSLFEHLRFPVGKYHEDEFTTYRAVYQAGRVAVTDARLYAYFQNDSGITGGAWKPKRLDVLEAFAQQMAFARETGNERLLSCVRERYLWSLLEHLKQAEADPAYKTYAKPLRKQLRQGMTESGIAFNRENLEFYEAAYPVKPVWGLAHWVYDRIRKKT